MDEVYSGQRDPLAMSTFVATDPNASGLVSVKPSTSKENITWTGQVRMSGGMGSSDAITSISNPMFEEGHNVIYFDDVVTGTVRVSYKTDILYKKFSPEYTEKNYPMSFSHYNQVLNYVHEVKATEFYPKPFHCKIDVSDFLDIEYADSINKQVTMAIVDFETGVEIAIKSTNTNIVGQIEEVLSDYGQYAFVMQDLPTIYLKYYANLFEVTLDKSSIKEVESLV